MEKQGKLLDERLQICLDLDTYNNIRIEAKRRGLKNSTYIRTILRKKFNKENGGK